MCVSVYLWMRLRICVWAKIKTDLHRLWKQQQDRCRKCVAVPLFMKIVNIYRKWNQFMRIIAHKMFNGHTSLKCEMYVPYIHICKNSFGIDECFSSAADASAPVEFPLFPLHFIFIIFFFFNCGLTLIVSYCVTEWCI